MNTSQTTEKSSAVSPSPLAEAAADTGAFCTHPQCRGKQIPAPFAFIRGDWVVKAACSQHATIRKDGAPWTLTDAQTAAAQYRRVEADFQDRIAARKKPSEKSSMAPRPGFATKMEPGLPWGLVELIEMLDKINDLEVARQKAALDIWNDLQDEWCRERQSGILVVRNEKGEYTFPLDRAHYRGAKLLKGMSREARRPLNFFVFRDEAEMVEFMKGRRESGPRRPEPKINGRGINGQGMKFGAKPAGVGSPKAPLVPTPVSREETKASREAREQNHETAVATELAARTGKSLFEAKTDLGLRDPVVVELIETDSAPASTTQVAAFKEQMKAKSAPKKVEKKPAKRDRRREAATN